MKSIAAGISFIPIVVRLAKSILPFLPLAFERLENMKFLAGYKTYLFAFLSTLWFMLHANHKLPISEETFQTVLALLVGGGGVSMRIAMAPKAEDKDATK